MKDPALNIDWLLAKIDDIILSNKDKEWVRFKDIEEKIQDKVQE